MRIISGKNRGLKLTEIGIGDLSNHLRPTSDRVKESLFNLLANGAPTLSFENIRVLDLFSGSGALGLEALSRGASWVTFFEKNKISLELLKKNISICQANGSTEVKQRDATKIGRNAYINDNFFYCTAGDYFIVAEKSSTCININVSLVKVLSIKSKLKRKIKEIIRPHDKFLLVRHYIIFPLFSLLQKKKNINILHASAVNIDGKGIIFSGLSGVGKSTLSIASVIMDKGLFITDNYLLYDDSKIYPFPEWIRLNQESYKLTSVDETGVVGKITRAFFYRYGRNYHQLESNVISPPVKCTAFIQLFLGDKFSANIISAEKAIDRTILNNAHVKEFPEHYSAPTN